MKKYFVLMLFVFSSCELPEKYFATIIICKSDTTIIINDKWVRVDEIELSVLHLIYENEIEPHEIKDLKVKILTDPERGVGIIKDIKPKLMEIGIRKIKYDVLGEKEKKYCRHKY